MNAHKKFNNLFSENKLLKIIKYFFNKKVSVIK